MGLRQRDSMAAPEWQAVRWVPLRVPLVVDSTIRLKGALRLV